MADPKVGTGKKPKGSGRRLYTDENPRDTVKIKFATPADARATVAKVKRISKPFARKIQILTVGEQRAKVMNKNQVAAIFKKGKEAIRKNEKVNGGVEHDGHGLLMAHASSWEIANRNPDLSRDEIGSLLIQAYGASDIVWGEGVWDQDITDYHIDSLARFTGPGRVLINLPKNPDRYDDFHQAALETYDRLVAYGLEVEVIPEPEKRRVKSLDFVASYANYYACNGAIVAAEFGDPEAGEIARDALSRHYPGREIVTLNVDPLGELGGGIHCATQQMPKV